MQLRSMTDKKRGSDPNKGDTRDPNQGQEDTQPVATTGTATDMIDGLDDIDRALRISTKKVKKFWYLPDLKSLD